MVKILFVCHGSTADSRELAVLLGQNGAKCGFLDSGVLRFYYERGNLKLINVKCLSGGENLSSGFLDCSKRKKILYLLYRYYSVRERFFF